MASVPPPDQQPDSMPMEPGNTPDEVGPTPGDTDNPAPIDEPGSDAPGRLADERASPLDGTGIEDGVSGTAGEVKNQDDTAQ